MRNATPQGPVKALAVDPGGTYLATAGVDSQIKVWDVRMLRPMHSYYSHAPVTSMAISQRGLLAVGYGRKLQVCLRLRVGQAEGYRT